MRDVMVRHKEKTGGNSADPSMMTRSKMFEAVGDVVCRYSDPKALYDVRLREFTRGDPSSCYVVCCSIVSRPQVYRSYLANN